MTKSQIDADRIRRLAIATFGLLAAISCGSARAMIVIDQNNMVSPVQNYNSSGLSPLGQEFTPTFNRLDVADLRIADAGSDTGPGANFHVRIRQSSITGTILGTSATILIPDNTNLGGGSIVTRFTFPTKVDLVPGNIYVLELVQQLPSFGDGTGNFAWTAGAAGGTYAGGRSIRQGNVVSDRDFLFATGANVPEPGSIGLVAGTLVLGSLFTLRRRRSPTSE